MKKRILSVLACMLLLVGLLPVGTLAEGAAPITEVVVTGVRGPSSLTGGSSLSINKGAMQDASGENRFYAADVIMLKSADGADEPYEETDDTEIVTGMYYGAIVVLVPEEGYYFDPSISDISLYRDEDQTKEVSYSNLFVTESRITFELYFGQAGEPEEEPEEPEEPVIKDLGRIDISVPEAEIGAGAVKPEDYAGWIDGEQAYMVVFSDWSGSFDGNGAFTAGQTYTLPITVAAVSGYVIGPETEIYVNGKCLFAKNESHDLPAVWLEYQSTTSDLPTGYLITLQHPENGMLRSMTENWEVITESVAGQTIFISLRTVEGYYPESIHVFLTNDPDVTITSEEINRDESGPIFKFTMPEGNVTVTATVTGLPKASVPEAVFTATGASTGTLTNVDSSMKWSLDGANYQQIQGDSVALTGLSAGTLYVVRGGDYITTSDSDPQLILIQKAAAPQGLSATDCTTEDNNDGTISGLDTNMEWKAAEEDDYHAVESDTLTGLTPGDYDFRYPYYGAVLASDKVTIRVGAFEAEEEYFNVTISGGSAYVDGVQINAALEGDLITIKADEMEGKVFVRWNTNQESIVLEDPESEETTFVMPAEDVIIMAEFEEAEDKGYEYVVIFSGNGADSGEMEDQVFYSKIEQPLSLNRFVREGYIFLGWSDSASGEKKYDDGEMILTPLAEQEGQTVRLFAVWEEIPPEEPEYMILISGGTAYVDGEPVSSAKEGTEVTIVAEEKDDKDFIKWLCNEIEMEDPESMETTFVMPAVNVVIMATYVEARGYQYTVEFDGNGADSGSMPEQTFYEKVPQKLNLNRFKREGYVFAGWSKSEEGGVDYTDGENITEPLSTKEGQIRTLYAVWTEKEPETQPTQPVPETQPPQPETQPPQPQTQPTAHQETQWTSPTVPSQPSSQEQDTIPVVVNTTDEEETEVETPEAETPETSAKEVTPSSAEPSSETTNPDNTEKEEQAVKRIRLVLGIAIGVVAAAIVIAVVFYQKEKKRHGNLL
ncbi:MAG: InlB B-repeat-containing protein [Lachnospiraceae bacterium]|nr:InlB B-repeat-containing protein [Lachnospiraceae bacterium]